MCAELTVCWCIDIGIVTIVAGDGTEGCTAQRQATSLVLSPYCSASASRNAQLIESVDIVNHLVAQASHWQPKQSMRSSPGAGRRGWALVPPAWTAFEGLQDRVRAAKT